MYTIYFPSTPLRPYIESFWFLRADLAPPVQLEEHIFADARADILINFGSPYIRHNVAQGNAAATMSASNLDAQRRYPVRISQQGHIDLVGIRFRPGGLAAFLPMPVADLDGLTLDLRDGFGLPGEDLEHRLHDAAGRRVAQVELLNEFFMLLLKAPKEHALVAHMAATIERHHGNISVQQLSAMHGYSIRTLDRQFRNVIGFPPKLYSRMLRFRQALNRMINDPAISWSDLASTFGYYDQPHFIKDFVEFTGTQPTAYRALLSNDDIRSAPNYVQFLQD